MRRADFAYVNDGTLEELDAFVAGVVAYADRRDEALSLLRAPARRRRGGASRYLRAGEPPGSQRLRYPLSTSRSSRGHARTTGSTRRCSRPSSTRRASSSPTPVGSGAIGLMQLLPGHGEGHRRSAPAAAASASGPLRPGDQRPLRLLVPAPPARQVRRREARARRLQRRPGERRRVAERRGGIQFPETRAYVERVPELKGSTRAPTRELA